VWKDWLIVTERFRELKSANTIDIREYIAHWHGLPALLWSNSYVASHCLAVAPQSGAKQIFYCTVFYISLNSNHEAHRAYKNLKKWYR